jgi:hypothetical protein
MKLPKKAFALVFLSVASCQAEPVAPASLCDPQSHVIGTEVRWQGVVVGTHQHGYGLTAENCERGFIRLMGVATAPGGRALESFFEPARLQPGVLRAAISGKITSADDGVPILLISGVHSLNFEKMNEEQERLYWRRRHRP